MSKVAVVYWSGTGNTEEMANKVAEGAKAAGAEVEVISADDFDGTDISSFDGVAFGCPAMGDEELEDSVFQPVFEACEPKLAGKKVALRFLRMETATGCAAGKKNARTMAYFLLLTV